MTELDLVVQTASIKAANEQAVVYGDFVTGPRCETGGGMPSDRVIGKSDLVLLDFSVILHGYRGDFATTFACQGPATTEQRRLADACVQAMAAGEKLLAPGRDCRDIDHAVRASFASQQLDQFFTSHSGHGLGLGHPDAPYIVADSTDSLMVGDIVANPAFLFTASRDALRTKLPHHGHGLRELDTSRLTLGSGLVTTAYCRLLRRAESRLRKAPTRLSSVVLPIEVV